MKVNADESDVLTAMIVRERQRRTLNIIFFTLLAILISIFIFGMGVLLGFKAGVYSIFEGIATITQGANFNGNITIDLNETQLVNEVNKTIIPQILGRGVK